MSKAKRTRRGEPPIVVPKSVPQPDKLPRRIRAIVAGLVAKVTV